MNIVVTLSKKNVETVKSLHDINTVTRRPDLIRDSVHLPLRNSAGTNVTNVLKIYVRCFVSGKFLSPLDFMIRLHNDQ